MKSGGSGSDKGGIISVRDMCLYIYIPPPVLLLPCLHKIHFIHCFFLNRSQNAFFPGWFSVLNYSFIAEGPYKAIFETRGVKFLETLPVPKPLG